MVVNGWLQKMERTDPSLCPVDVALLTYGVASSYMAQLRNGEGNYYLKSHYCGACLGFINLFTMSNTAPPPGFCDHMQTLMKGFKRTIVTQKGGHVLCML